MAEEPSGPPPPGPLAGIRVTDCSTVLAGPFCTMLLADLGADVVKVEPPEGDPTRRWGPPWVGDEASGTRTAAYFLAANRNKRSICVDLHGDDGRRVLRRLLARSDVFVENFRPGGLDRLGFDDDALATLNPSLVHLAVSGFGRGGPDAAKPGYDLVAQAVGGLMSITGASDDEGGRPTKVGVAISDVVSGLFGAVAILAALVAREGGGGTRRTGDSAAREHAVPQARRGQRIDVSLLGSTLASLVNQAQNAFVSGTAPMRLGNRHPNLVPYETFATADGELVVAVGSERQWGRLCRALGTPTLADDPRFATNADRVTNRDALVPLLSELFAGRLTGECLALLDAAEVPAAPVLDVLGALEAPQARSLGTVVELAHPAWGAVLQVAPPFRLAGTPATIRTPPPLLGEHTRAILAELDEAEAAGDGA